METVYQGICAGIGDRANDINVIEPWFDAAVRKFIIGQNGIIDGFTIVFGKITKGVCVAQGYVGYIEQDVNMPTGYKAYGKFEINRDKSLPDKFSVIVTDENLTQQDNILHGAGVFYLSLIEDNRIKYPLNAYHADNATIVKAGGVRSSTNLENGVTAVTETVDDYSKRVATTEFVQNKIRKEINAATMPTVREVVKSGVVTFTTEITARRKSAYVLLALNVTFDVSYLGAPNIGNLKLASIPIGFRPKTTYVVGEITGQNALNTSKADLQIKSDGDVYISGGVTADSSSFFNVLVYPTPIGYETN